jgi:hypothetical protein
VLKHPNGSLSPYTFGTIVRDPVRGEKVLKHGVSDKFLEVWVAGSNPNVRDPVRGEKVLKRLLREICVAQQVWSETPFAGKRC